MNKKKLDLQNLGGISGIYFAIAYIIMILFFVVIVDYPNISEQSDKIEMFINNKAGMSATYLFGYVIFGLLLAVFSLAVYDRLKASYPNAAKLSAIYGIMWGCLLIGSGMLYIKGIASAVDMYAKDPAQAITVWTSIEATALALSFSEGEIIGGIWTLLISITALKAKAFHKGICYVGIVAGVAGILSIIPAVNVLGGTAIFGITQIVWYVLMGITLLKQPKDAKY